MTLSMPASPYRFEPFLPDRFAPGVEPFRTRGVAYIEALEYVDKRLEGGRARLRQELGGNPHLPYLDQLFLVTGEYDTSPLVALYLALADVRGETPQAFVERGSERSAARMALGIWKPMLKTASPEAMAERTHLAFNRFFSPTRAAPIGAEKGRFEGQLTGMPAPLRGFYMSSTNGFMRGALEVAGAHRIRIEWHPASPDGSTAGVDLERARFVATYESA